MFWKIYGGVACERTAPGDLNLGRQGQKPLVTQVLNNISRPTGPKAKVQLSFEISLSLPSDSPF